MKIKCTRCGKPVSSVEVPAGTVIRAFIECPECCEKQPDEKQPDEKPKTIELKLAIGLIALGSGLTGLFYSFIF